MSNKIILEANQTNEFVRENSKKLLNYLDSLFIGINSDQVYVLKSRVLQQANGCYFGGIIKAMEKVINDQEKQLTKTAGE